MVRRPEGTLIDAATLLEDVAARALGITPDAAADMHDNQDLVPALLARLCVVNAELVAELRLARGAREKSVTAPTPEATFLRAVRDEVGADRWIGAELLEWTSDVLASRRGRVRSAAEGLVEGEFTLLRFGIRLREIAEGGAVDGLRLCADGQRDHTNVWYVDEA